MTGLWPYFALRTGTEPSESPVRNSSASLALHSTGYVYSYNTWNEAGGGTDGLLSSAGGKLR